MVGQKAFTKREITPIPFFLLYKRVPLQKKEGEGIRAFCAF